MNKSRLYYNRILENKSTEKKAHLRQNLIESRPTIELLIEILEDRLEDLDRDLEAKTLYEKASFAYKVADVLGARREVNKLLKQLEDRSDHD